MHSIRVARDFSLAQIRFGVLGLPAYSVDPITCMLHWWPAMERTNAPTPSSNPRLLIEGLQSSYAHQRNSENGSTLLIDGKQIKPKDDIVFLHLTDKAPCRKFTVDKSQQIDIQLDFNQRDPKNFITNWYSE